MNFLDPETGHETHLEVLPPGPFSETCSGCHREIPERESAVTNIDSCCGQCVRWLCFECVHAAVAMIDKILSKRDDDDPQKKALR